MREILFRAKPLDEKRWVYGYLLRDEIVGYMIQEIDELDGFIHVQEDTIQQYTGLQDKNGTKIFEGDIVKFEHPSRDVMSTYVVNGTFSFTGVVVFEDCYFALKKKRENLGCDFLQLYQARAYRDYHDGVIEIIGNIHDNLELLGDKQDAEK